MMEPINTKSLENEKFKPHFDCWLSGRDRAVHGLHDVHLEDGNIEIEDMLLKDDEETLLELIEVLS